MYRLLLVDDEKMVLVSVRRGVPWADYGFTQIQASVDPHEALRLLRETRIDAACIDIRMPGLSAFDVIERCVKEGIQTTFLILTGYSDFQYAQQALRLGVYDFLLKPLQPEDTAEFLPKLKEHIRARRLREDPSVYDALLRGEKLKETLLWMGLTLTRPYLGLLFLCGHPQDTVPIPHLVSADSAVLMLRLNETVLLFSANVEPSAKIEEWVRCLPFSCGASFRLVGQNAEHLPAALAKAKLESEEGLKKSISSGLPVLRMHDFQGNQPWNDSFLQLMQEVDAHYTENLSLSDLAAAYNISYSYCSSLFTQRVGTTFSKYISDLRMRRAKELLGTTKLPIGVVCEQVGYQDYHHFAKTFKKAFGQTPSEYRTAGGKVRL